MAYESALDRYNRVMEAKQYGRTSYSQPTSAVTSYNLGETTSKEKEKNKGGLLGGIGYVGEKLGLGILRSVEGISDFVLGGVADLFGADDFADELLKSDWVDYTHADNWYNPDGVMSFVGDVSQGIGGMLPAVALSFVPVAGPALSHVAFGLGAAGQSVSDMTKQNGTASGKEWLYGIGSGLLETGIEAATAGFGGSQMGKVLGKQLAKTTGGKLATAFVSEGLEEVASDLLDPALQRTTGVNKEATVDWKNLPKTFLVGGATGSVMGGGYRALNAAKVGGFKNLAVAETAQELNERLSDNNVRQAKNKKATYTAKDIGEVQERLSKRLQKLDDEGRANFFKENNRLAKYFNADGTLTSEAWESARRAPARFSIETDEKGRQYVQADRKVLSGTNAKAWGEQITEYINEKIRNGEDIKIKTVEGDTLTITENTAGKAAFQNKGLDQEGYKTKLQAEAHIDELSQISKAQKDQYGNKKIKTDIENKHVKRNLAKDGWSYRNAYFKDFDGNEYKLTLSVAMDGTVESVYNVGKIEKHRPGESRLMPQRAADVSINSIREKNENVNSLEEKSAKTNSARYSIKNIDGKDIVSIDTDQNIFDGVERKDYGKVAREYIKSHFRGKRVNDVAFTKYSENEYIRSKETQRLYGSDSSVYDTKMKASTELDNFVKTGKFIQHEEAKHPHPYNEGGYDRYAVEFALGGESFTGEMLVAKNNENKTMFYDIVNIKEKNTLRYPDAPLKGSEGGKNVLSTNSIREKNENVNSLEEKNSKTNSQTIGNLSEATYSASLKGRESTLKYQPVTSASAQNENARRAMRDITLITGGRVDVVLTEDIRTADGRIANGEYADGVLYVNVNADSSNRAMFIISHELTHTLEGTKEYAALGSFIQAQIALDPALAEKYNLKKYLEAYKGAHKGEYSEETLKYEARTEMYADFVADEILSNESTVRRLVSRNRNIALRFVEWVRSTVERLGKSKEERAEYDLLRRAEKLFVKALENSKGGVTLEEVEKTAQVLKDMKKTAQTIEENTTDESSSEVATISGRYNLQESIKTLQGYTEEEIASIQKNRKYFVANSYNDVIAFLDSAEKGENKNCLLFIGKVSDKMSSYIQDEINIDIKGKSIALSSDNIRHILVKHGEEIKEGKRGQVVITKEKLEDIIETIVEPDSVSKEVDDSGKVSILFEKVLNGRNLAITILSNKKNALTLKSARVFKNSISPSNDAKASRSTSKTIGSMDDSSTISIREGNEKVNSFDEKSLKKFSSRYFLENYTKEQVKNWKKSKRIIVYENDVQLETIIEASLLDKKYDKKVYFGAIGEELAKLIQKKTGLNLKNFNCSISTYEIRKILKDHGIDEKEQTRGQRAVTKKDIVNIPNIMQNPTDIILSPELYDGKPVIHFERKENNEKTTVVAVVSNKHLDLRVQTEYIGIKKERTLATPISAEALSIRPKRNSGTDLSTNSIREGNEKVNSFDEKSLKKDLERYSINVKIPHTQESEARHAGYAEELSQYTHRINLTDEIKADVRKKFGRERAERMFAVWENTTERTDGVDIPTAHKELTEKGFKTYSVYYEDFLGEMDSTLRHADRKTYRKAEKGVDVALDISTSKNENEAAKPKDEELTNRQIQTLANWKNKKVYSKSEAEIIINDILDTYMNFEDTVGNLSGKTQEEAVRMLWRGMNGSNRTKTARDVANYLLEHAILENIYGDALVESYSQTIDILRPYLHKLDLTDIKEGLKERYGDDLSYTRWEKAEGDTGIRIEDAADALREAGFYIEEATAMDAFLAIEKAYQQAIDNIKKNTSRIAEEIVGKNKKAFQQEMAKELLREFDAHGQDSALAMIENDYKKQIRSWKKKVDETREKNRVINRILEKAQKIKDVKTGAFINASVFKRDIFKGSIECLGKIKHRGDLNRSGTRKIFASLLEWYSKDNPMLEGDGYVQDVADALMRIADNKAPMSERQYEELSRLERESGESDVKKIAEWYTRKNLGSEWDSEVKEWLKDLANPKNFSLQELKDMKMVLDYFEHTIKNYNKIFRNGKRIDAIPIAEKGIANNQKNARVKIGWLRKFFEGFIVSYADPMTVARYFDKYARGFYTESMEEFREAAVEAEVMEMRLRDPLENFYKKHKNFLKESEKREIIYRGKSMNVQTAMLLHMTLKRDHALKGLAYSGFKYNKTEEYIESVQGFATAENLEWEELKLQAEAEQNELVKQFTETELEYIAIVEKIFNEDCKSSKKKTDIERMGFSNVSDGYYVPIRRTSIAYNIGKQGYADEMMAVTNQSFNENTVAGAENQLFIDGLTHVAEKHIEGISQYCCLAHAADNYRVVLNLNLSGNPNRVISIKSESENTWKEGVKYFADLVQSMTNGVGKDSKIVSFFRGSYAKYQLGFNPKVWITQLTSFSAAINVLDPGCIIRGMTVKVDGNVLDEYCELARVRNSENTAALAQGVLEKMDKIGDALMKPIGIVDRFVVSRLFGACQLQVQKNGGAAVGTKENLSEAGKLLKRVILETQQNSVATERSAAMRSESEFSKAITMFSADSMKITGRLIDALGEIAVLRKQLRMETDGATIESIKKRLKAANKKAGRAMASMLLSSIFMAAIAQAFNWWYRKNEDEEDKTREFITDAVGNLLGGLPLIRNFYTYMTDGFEVESFAYISINDLFASFAAMFNLIGDALTSKPVDKRDIMLTFRKFLYSFGQITGIPTRNIYNVLYGTTNRISPEFAYKWNDNFYKQSYRADLAKAIESDDEDMIETIVGLMLNENIGNVTDSAVRKEMQTLVESGCDVIPKSVPETITYKDENGESQELVLTAAQTKKFKQIYTTANDKLSALLKLSQYKSASEEVRAKAIKFIYDTYYSIAINKLSGINDPSKNALFAVAIDIEELALITALAKSFTVDVKGGKTINGSRKAKVQAYVNTLRLSAEKKHMLMGYLGYSNKSGEEKVKAYINHLNLTKEQKQKLYEYCGY